MGTNTSGGINISSEQKMFISIGVLSLAILLGGFFLTNRQESKLMGDAIEEKAAVHVKRGEKHPAYKTNPPTSGWHWGDGVAGAGVHDTEVPDELLVHSLEHGAVVVYYKSDLPKETVDFVKNAYNDASGKKILVPRKNLDVPIALTSWGRLLKIKIVQSTEIPVVKATIKEFIETNSDRGPEKAQI